MRHSSDFYPAEPSRADYADVVSQMDGYGMYERDLDALLDAMARMDEDPNYTPEAD